ncbi:MAG: energy-coupling factor ABC transporter permease [Sulfolobales archaeon]
MHIPDGFLSLPVALLSLLISAAFLVLSVIKVRSKKLLASEKVSILTSLSAGLFSF